MTKVVWSHSSLKDFEGCARRYHEIKVLKKYKFQETDATRYGTDLHKAAEDYLADGVVLPSRFTFVKDVLDVLNKEARAQADRAQNGADREAAYL